MTTVDQAVKLVTQAVQQDSKCNYVEAARCYREALVIFYDIEKSGSCSKRLQDLLKTKIVQYQDRLKILDEYLLSNTDLTELFKELDTCHLDDCRSSISSTSSLLYKNPLLTKSLNLIRRGRKEDENKKFGAALVCYESGLSSLLDLLNHGDLSDRQAESARIKYLLYHERAEEIRGFLEKSQNNIIDSKFFKGQDESLDSDDESPVPWTESEKTLQMEEVRSLAGSRVGSSQTLNVSYDKVVESMKKYHSSNSLAKRDASSKTGSYNVTIKESLHSLYPHCDIKTSPSVLSLEEDRRSSKRDSTISSVPLANLGEELSLSSTSIHSKHSIPETSRHIQSEPALTYSDMPIVKVNSMDDIFESELVKLNDNCDDTKSQSSDSGYSGTSPDCIYSHGSKSPGSQDTLMDRQSPLYDTINEDIDNCTETNDNELLPDVIVINETKQQNVDPSTISRVYGQQHLMFQNPEKDILISQLSQDNLAVLAEDSIDGIVKTPSKTYGTRVDFPDSPNCDFYTPRASGTREYIPPRTVAKQRGEHGNMNKGFYYLMSALDFCWCL